MWRLTVLLCSSFFVSLVCASSIDVFEFSDPQNREAYKELTRELRCPKCQNQDIADSNAPIAKDMRAQVYRLLEEGKSQEEVIDYMVERFGDFVTYKPKVSVETYLLWYGPWVFVALGALTIVLIARRKTKTLPNDKSERAPAQDKDRVQALLEKYSDD